MKRLAWTILMGAAGFFLGRQGQGGPADWWFSFAGLAWGAAVGFGLGSIFGQGQMRGRPLILFWTFTFALIGPFVSLIIGADAAGPSSSTQIAVIVLVGVLCGAAVGLVTGIILSRGSRAER